MRARGRLSRPPGISVLVCRTVRRMGARSCSTLDRGGHLAFEGGPHRSGFRVSQPQSSELSAHASGLAVDIASFELANGEVLSIAEAKDERKMAVLATLRTAACGWFTTILGPGSDAAHATHWHLDIERHGSSDRYRICQ